MAEHRPLAFKKKIIVLAPQLKCRPTVVGTLIPTCQVRPTHGKASNAHQRLIDFHGTLNLSFPYKNIV
jgi:hypothetical protein